MAIGETAIEPHVVLQVLANKLWGAGYVLDPIDAGVVWNYRLTRALVAAACGAGLATCGVILQSLLRNPLADPYLLGISAGDTLFKRGVGRTDLWGGDQATIVRSIKQRLYTLDEGATVVTGHGPDTRLGDEMRENPFVRA